MTRLAIALMAATMFGSLCLSADYQSLRVYNVVPARELTTAEKNFLATVPDGPDETTLGLRDACRQMLLAGVIHVPQGGKYRVGDSVRYWSMYQVWTAPKVVNLPASKPDRRPKRHEPSPELEQMVPCPAPCLQIPYIPFRELNVTGLVTSRSETAGWFAFARWYQPAPAGPKVCPPDTPPPDPPVPPPPPPDVPPPPPPVPPPPPPPVPDP